MGAASKAWCRPSWARPIEKGRPGPGLLAHVVSSKYADHMPLYRLEQIFERHGVQITRRTLSEWNGAVADLLEPIVRVMHREQVGQSPWIQCDDTTLDVQDPSRAPEIRTGHLWVYRGELGEVVYDFTWSRNRDGPLKMLSSYRGYLQVDAAPAYDDVFAQFPAIIEIGCWAHARRYFKEALPTAAVSCAQALAIIKQLYGIERAASDRQLDAPARQRLRQEQARPLLAKLQAYLQEQQAAALPKGPLGAAIGYALRNWVALTRYTEDGRLKIDNNGAEQALRPIVLGRKNWLFAGSEAAAHRTAILCSLVQNLQAPADQSVRLSARCDRARLDASGAGGPGADATPVEAPAAELPHPSRRLNRALGRAGVSCPVRSRRGAPTAAPAWPCRPSGRRCRSPR